MRYFLAACSILAVPALIPPSIAEAMEPPPLRTSYDLDDYAQWIEVASGYVFVLHSSNSGLTQLTTGLAPVSTWSLDEVCSPLAVSASRGRIYVSDIGGGNCTDYGVHVFDFSGSYVDGFCSRNTDCLTDRLAADRRGNLIAMDHWLVQVFNSRGDIVQTWGRQGSGPGEIDSYVNDLTVAPDGTYFVIDQENHRIERFAASGEFILEWGSEGREPGQFRSPVGVAVDSDGHVFVSDYRRDDIQVFDMEGNYIGAWEQEDVGRISVDDRNNLFVLVEKAVLKYAPLNTPVPIELPPAEPAVYLHVAPAGDKATLCEDAPGDPKDVVTSAPLNETPSFFHVYLLATPRTLDEDPGVTGLQTSVAYDPYEEGGSGLFVFDWTECSVLGFPQDGWPESDTGNTLTWLLTDCPRKAIVTAGVFYVGVYSPSVFAVRGYSSTESVKVTGCYGAEKTIGDERMGWASFGGARHKNRADGCNPVLEPCGEETGVEQTTWGTLKNRYR